METELIRKLIVFHTCFQDTRFGLLKSKVFPDSHTSFLFKDLLSLEVVACTFDRSKLDQRQADLCEFEISLVYKTSEF